MHLSPPLVAKAAVRSKAVVLLLLLNYCFINLPLFVWVLCSSLFWYALLYVLSKFAIILTRKKELVALVLLSFGCLVAVNVLFLFLMVPWVGLQFVIVVFLEYSHLLLYLFLFPFEQFCNRVTTIKSEYYIKAPNVKVEIILAGMKLIFSRMSQ